MWSIAVSGLRKIYTLSTRYSKVTYLSLKVTQLKNSEQNLENQWKEIVKSEWGPARLCTVLGHRTARWLCSGVAAEDR